MTGRLWNQAGAIDVCHYLWAGLDFILDGDGAPVLLEANRASHMLWEYILFFESERPFELIARRMNRADGPSCFVWRRSDVVPPAGEDAAFICSRLAKYLERQPHICDVEENENAASSVLRTRDGNAVRPGSVFRWWYGLPWVFERTGTLVINPNCVWVVVRDKLGLYELLGAQARYFRVPASFEVRAPEDARALIAGDSLFLHGFVLKPRVGWGGQGVQVGNVGDDVRPFAGSFVLSERIVPPRHWDFHWHARAFVMDGQFVGAIRCSSLNPVTNQYQGGVPGPLDDATMRLLEPAVLEAVALIDKEAERVNQLSEPPSSDLVRVDYRNS